MRVLVTGAGGSIGSAVVRELLNSADVQVAGVDLCTDKIPTAERVAVYGGDIRQPLRMLEIFEAFRPEVVYHAADLKDVPGDESDVVETLQTNVFGTCHVVWAAQRTGVKTVVLVSTVKAVKPAGVMGATKRLCELFFREQTGSTRFIVVRLGNVLESSGSVLRKFRSQVENGGPLTVTHAGMQRYCLSVEQAVQALLRAAEVGESGDVVVPEMGKPVEILTLAKDLLKGHPRVGIQLIGTRAGEKLQDRLWDGDSEEFVRACGELRIYRHQRQEVWPLIASLHSAWMRGPAADALGPRRQDAQIVKALRQLTRVAAAPDSNPV